MRPFQLIFLHCLLLHRTAGTAFLLDIISPGQLRLSSGSSMPLTAPAIDMGVIHLNQKYADLFQVNLTYVYDGRFQDCDDLIAGIDFIVADYYYRRRVNSNATVFFHPGCNVDSVSVAKLTTGWKQLIIIGSYNNLAFRNKNFYPNVIQGADIMYNYIVRAMMSFNRNFNWNILYILVDRAGTSSGMARAGSSALLTRLQETKQYVAYYVIVDTAVGNPFEAALADIRSVARVVSFWGHATSLRAFMIAAHRANMTSGDYVFFFLSVFVTPTVVFGNATWQNFDEYDQLALMAFRPVFLIIPTPTASASNEAIRKRLITTFGEWSRDRYNYTYARGDGPSAIVSTQYACLEILGQILASTLARDPQVDLSETADLAGQFASRSFNTTFGTIKFDSVGERQVQFDVQQLDTSTGIFQPVLRQDLDHFDKFIALRNITWQMGGPPPDQPACGFSGGVGSCGQSGENKQNHLVTGLVVGFLLILAIPAVAYTRKVARNELEKHGAHWDITEDVVFKGVRSLRYSKTVTSFMLAGPNSRQHLKVEAEAQKMLEDMMDPVVYDMLFDPPPGGTGNPSNY